MMMNLFFSMDTDRFPKANGNGSATASDKGCEFLYHVENECCIFLNEVNKPGIYLEIPSLLLPPQKSPV